MQNDMGSNPTRGSCKNDVLPSNLCCVVLLCLSWCLYGLYCHVSLVFELHVLHTCNDVLCCRMYLVFLSLFTHVHIHLSCLSSDPTLTTHNVVEMMKGVDYGNLQWVLNVSYDKWSEIRDQYQSDEQRCEALITHTLSTHPCMSWKLIARGLQWWGYRKAAAEVTRKYVKGQLRTTRHINMDPCTVSSGF